jgi:hypothetical protein
MFGASLVLSAVLAFSSGATPTDLAGVWGGDRTVLTFGVTGATIQSDCAQGAITGPILLAADGHFRASGTFENQGPGPQEADRAVLPAASFTGQVDGDTMVLTVHESGGRAPMRLTLRRGVRPKLVRCL